VWVRALRRSPPASQSLAQAALASGAVLAIFIGVAVSTPLGNLGAGVLLAFTQPIRLGDRISIADQTGVVEEMSLSYTVLLTDEGRHVFVPNLQIVSAVVVNRSVGDARRIVTVELPVALGAPLDREHAVTRDATATIARDAKLDLDVRVGTVGEKIVWLTVVAMAPPDADTGRIASDVRSAALGALATAELLPAA
jgi:small-conductance mechanosensitive channel